MKIVVGGTYRQYREWLRDNQLSERAALYADTEEKLMGLELSPDDIVRLGYGSPRFEEILLTRIRRPSTRNKA